jgi:hypothetical protein
VLVIERLVQRVAKVLAQTGDGQDPLPLVLVVHARILLSAD